MLQLAFKMDLIQIVADFTRIQGNSKSILDLIFVSGTISTDARCEVVSGIYDEYAVLVTLEDSSVNKKNNTKSYANFSLADDVSMIGKISLNFDDFVNFTGECERHWELVMKYCT